MLNLMTVQVGEVLLLKDGTRGEVIENMGDGIWMQLRDPVSGDENLVHCEEIVGLADENDARNGAGGR
jgi:hypothetical protein